MNFGDVMVREIREICENVINGERALCVLRFTFCILCSCCVVRTKVFKRKMLLTISALVHTIRSLPWYFVSREN